MSIKPVTVIKRTVVEAIFSYIVDFRKLREILYGVLKIQYSEKKKITSSALCLYIKTYSEYHTFFI